MLVVVMSLVLMPELSRKFITLVASPAATDLAEAIVDSVADTPK
jgi:hypothetical protein